MRENIKENLMDLMMSMIEKGDKITKMLLLSSLIKDMPEPSRVSP